MSLNFDRLLILSTGFFLLFTSFATAQSLATKVLDDNDFGNLGFYSLGLLYCVFGVCSFIATPIVKKFGTKQCLILGALCYSLYVGTFVLPAYRT